MAPACVGIAAERGAIVLDRAVAVGEILLVQLAEAEAQRHRLVDVLAEAEAPLEQIGELGVAMRGHVALLERLARLGVVREHLEHLLVGADRLHRPVEVALAQLRQLHQIMAPAIVVARRQLGAAHVDLVAADRHSRPST